MINLKPHFIAKLKYKTTEEGGRKTPAKSNYRPQVKFGFTKYDTSGIQRFLDKDIVFPGESVLAEITVMSPQFFKGMLKVGMEFDFREGSKIIGFGELIEILDSNLIQRS